jgi:hypothetical protein
VEIPYDEPGFKEHAEFGLEFSSGIACPAKSVANYLEWIVREYEPIEKHQHLLSGRYDWRYDNRNLDLPVPDIGQFAAIEAAKEVIENTFTVISKDRTTFNWVETGLPGFPVGFDQYPMPNNDWADEYCFTWDDFFYVDTRLNNHYIDKFSRRHDLLRWDTADADDGDVLRVLLACLAITYRMCDIEMRECGYVSANALSENDTVAEDTTESGSTNEDSVLS